MNSNKRLLKEIRELYIQQNQKNLLDNNYLIYYDELNINKVYAIIKAPYDSIYRHKFVRLNITIPNNYPYSPPEVTFINYNSVRIHPNMYENGKCCATILNTWGDNIYEKWTSSMGIETILLTFHSFLDNNPYMYEPGGRDDETYTDYVKHESWYSCLMVYLQNETVEIFNQYMHNYLMLNIDEIFKDLQILKINYPTGYYNCRCFEIDNYIINYDKIIISLQNSYNYIDYIERKYGNDNDIDQNLLESFDDFINKEYDCNICFDTNQTDNDIVNLSCNHCFHESCLYSHIKQNQKLCSMCRKEILDDEINKLFKKIEWVINPLTKRRIKIGGKTYIELKDNGYF
jgi:ubiquitin-protein ligase